jgi:hypothetical protein
VLISPYFLSLDRKKVAKKDQGKHDPSGRFALPAPHIRLRAKTVDYNKKK